MEARGYSLWLMPGGDVGDRLTKIIRAVSETYDTPAFPPHVTLLAGLERAQAEIVNVAWRLARTCQPFDIELNGLATTGAYFKSLFILVRDSHSLREMHAAAVRQFAIQPKPQFMPHLSILYGDLPEARKQDIIAELGAAHPGGFSVESVEVYRTEGRPEDWRPVVSLPLTLESVR